MSLPEYTKKLVEQTLATYCDERVPAHARHQVQLKFSFRGDTVTLFEERKAWDDPTKTMQINIARFKFESKSKKWSLYWADRNSKWKLYEYVKPSAVFTKLLEAVEEDITRIFWG